MQAFNRFLNKNKLGLLLGGLFFLVGLATINDYGLTFDEPYHKDNGLLLLDFFGQRGVTLAGRTIYSPPMDLLGGLSVQLLSLNLKWLPLDAALHLPTILVASLAIFLLFLFVKKLLGTAAAIVTSLFLATYPRFFGHVHQNVKDVPSAIAFFLAIAAGYFAFEKKTWPWVIIFGTALGLGIATKVNGIFVLPILGLWRLVAVSLKPSLKVFQEEAKTWIRLLPAGIIAFAIWFILSPNYWGSPFDTFLAYLNHFRTTWLGNPVLFWEQTFAAGHNLPFYYAPTYLTLVTPLPMLAAVMVGVVVALKKIRQSPLYPLLLVWLAFPLAKYLYPRFILYDDIRQFLEVVFPLAALAAIGVVETASWLKTRLKVIPSRLLLPLLTTLALLPSLFALVRYHPYQIAYLNGLIGGAGGAQGKFDLDFWATTIKEMTLWVNERAEPGETVNAVLGNHIVPYYLRADLSIVYDSLEEPDYLLIVNRQSFLLPEVTEYLADKEPVYVIIRDGADLGWIYRN